MADARVACLESDSPAALCVCAGWSLNTPSPNLFADRTASARSARAQSRCRRSRYLTHQLGRVRGVAAHGTVSAFERSCPVQDARICPALSKSSLRVSPVQGGHTLQGSAPHAAGPDSPPLGSRRQPSASRCRASPHAAGPGVAAAVSVPRCGRVRLTFNVFLRCAQRARGEDASLAPGLELVWTPRRELCGLPVRTYR